MLILKFSIRDAELFSRHQGQVPYWPRSTDTSKPSVLKVISLFSISYGIDDVWPIHCPSVLDHLFFTESTHGHKPTSRHRPQEDLQDRPSVGTQRCFQCTRARFHTGQDLLIRPSRASWATGPFGVLANVSRIVDSSEVGEYLPAWRGTTSLHTNKPDMGQWIFTQTSGPV